jgi:hypothetical protein
MPWAAYDETGRLQIGFFDRSYDSANHLYGYTLASEKSKGQLDFTFQQLTTTLSDPTQGDRWFGVTVNSAFPHATRFLGDYSGIAAVPGERVAALWTDMRNSVTFLGGTGSGQDAYFALVKAVPANTPHGATSVGGGISTVGAAVVGGGIANVLSATSTVDSNFLIYHQANGDGGAHDDATSSAILTIPSVTNNQANGSQRIGGGAYTVATSIVDAFASNDSIFP